MASGGSFSRSVSPAWPSPPPAQGLYDPKREHDACGVGFVADLKGRPSHKIIEHGIQILENLTHRGATGADPLAGDGAGILVQIPHEFLKEVTRSAQDQATRARPLRRRPHVHAAQSRAAHLLRVRCRARRRGGGLEAARLARRAVGQFLPVGIGDRDRADAPPGVYRSRARRRGRGRFRAQALRAAQGDLQHHQRRYRRSRHRFLYRVAVLPHAGLQGHVPRLSARSVLPRSASSVVRLGARARASALLDQHLPILEARPPLPHGRP